MPCGARAGRIDSGRNSERHVPRRKAGARTTSTTGNSQRGFIDQVPGPTAPAGDMAVRNSPASTRRDTKTLQMRICDIPRCGELKFGDDNETHAHGASRNACARRVLWCRARGRLDVAPSASLLLEQYRWRGSPSRAWQPQVPNARIDHVRRRRGPVAQRRCARAARPSRRLGWAVIELAGINLTSPKARFVSIIAPPAKLVKLL